MENGATPNVGAMSVSEFCRKFKISRSHFYKIVSHNKGPRLMRVGGRRLISFVSAEEWRNKMEMLPSGPSNDNKKLQKK